MTQAEKDKIIKDLQEKLAEAEKIKVDEPKQPKRWKPKENEEYWTIDVEGQVDCVDAYPDEIVEWDYLTGNCFKTKEEAEEYKKKIEYTARYKNYIEEHSEPLDWNNGKQEKYGAYLHTGENVIQVDYFGTDNSWETQTKYQGMICASSEQIIWDAIEEIGEDNFKKYVLGVK